MKDTILGILSALLILIYFLGIGLILWKLGIELPIALWNAGNYGWSIIQALLVWSYALTSGGKGK